MGADRGVRIKAEARTGGVKVEIRALVEVRAEVGVEVEVEVWTRVGILSRSFSSGRMGMGARFVIEVNGRVDRRARSEAVVRSVMSFWKSYSIRLKARM